MPMDKPTHKERIREVLAGGRTDRVPVALWRHFPVDDQDPVALAESSIAFQKQYDLDVLKVTPASSFCLKDWGAEDRWEGNAEGTREYTRYIIQQPQDWERLRILDPRDGYLGAQLRCLKIILDGVGSTTPVLQTIFNPLAQAKNLCGDKTLKLHLQKHPEAVRAGLDIIRQSTLAFTEACLELGVDGIFLAVQHATSDFFREEEYQQWGVEDDRTILDAARGAWLNMLHIHGNGIYFRLVSRYPAQVINWHDRETGPSLAEGRAISNKAVCGGWRQWETMALGDGNKVEEEARDAIVQMEGRNLILGTGCVTPIIAPGACLRAAARPRSG
jgi:uroporphyrinogen decarboxylase